MMPASRRKFLKLSAATILAASANLSGRASLFEAAKANPQELIAFEQRSQVAKHFGTPRGEFATPAPGGFSQPRLAPPVIATAPDASGSLAKPKRKKTEGC